MSDIRLKVFHSVATHLSFTKAATELFITQPAVTKHIKELESEYNLRLFDRKGNKISLTQAGQIMLNYAEQINELYRKINFDLNVIKNQYAGQLQLGASTTISQYILPPVLARFYQHFTEVHLSLISANTQRIEKALIEKKIELGIVEGKTKNNQLKYIPFMEDEIVAVVHTRQKLAQRDEISLEELKEIPLVLRELGSGSLEVILDFLHQHHIELKNLKVAMHLGSTESIKAFLGSANCLGFASVAAVSKEIASGEFKIIDITGLDITRTFFFVHLQGKSDGLSDTFMQFARKHYN